MARIHKHLKESRNKKVHKYLITSTPWWDSVPYPPNSRFLTCSCCRDVASFLHPSVSGARWLSLGRCQSSASARYGREKKHLYPQPLFPKLEAAHRAHSVSCLCALKEENGCSGPQRTESPQTRQCHRVAESLSKRHWFSPVVSAEQRVCASPCCWLLPHFISFGDSLEELSHPRPSGHATLHLPSDT